VCYPGSTADEQPQQALTYCYLSQSTANQNLLVYFLFFLFFFPQEGVEDGAVVCIIGNKTDLAELEPDKFKVTEGSKMAVVSVTTTNVLFSSLSFQAL
jgi:hypothetical protein